MSAIVRLLITDTWWTYHPSGGWFTHVYSWFNVIEGCFLLLFAALVLRRYLNSRRSPIELAYALAFFTFGLSDFRESYVLESWLVLFKGVNLAALLALRWHVLKHYHPQCRAF
jgi:hypothetical protein